MELPTREELRKFKVVELRQKLSSFSLPQAGTLWLGAMRRAPELRSFVPACLVCAYAMD